MFQVAEGKLPADCLVYYLPFSLMKVVRNIYSIDKSGLIRKRRRTQIDLRPWGLEDRSDARVRKAKASAARGLPAHHRGFAKGSQANQLAWLVRQFTCRFNTALNSALIFEFLDKIFCCPYNKTNSSQ
ncbi:MAG: hypothetical protein GYA35_07145 [Thermoanaerobaculaceae bacterium]|nr:hypothetical protein [Thermoanaerobaculaceae bacterium]